MRYRTTFGGYAVILGLGPAGIGLATLSFGLNGWWLMAGLGVALPCLFGWILLETRYVVEQDVLDVRFGPFRRRIPLNEVTDIHRHRMRNGPMFGLGSDFIDIEYGEQAVNVSPRDADGFIQAVRQRTERPGRPQSTWFGSAEERRVGVRGP